jgi:hypothetical protein
VPSSTVRPGTRFAGRYRLEDHVVDVAGTSYWRAVDETLGRDVGVRTVALDDPLAGTVTDAARAAAASHDARFLRVLDVSQEQGQVYVVSEWVSGRSLEQLLQDGPLPDHDAVRLAREVAEALAAAHRQGLAHRCLRPASVVVTDTGQVKLVGLTVDAAVAGLPEVDRATAAREDAEGCGRLLFAALTGRWLGDGPTGPDGPVPSSDLPHLPDDDRPVAPRQVRGGVPAALDAVTVRALGRPAHRQEPLTTPAAVASALEQLDVFDPGVEGDRGDDATPTAVVPIVRELGSAPPVLPAERATDPTGTTRWVGWAVAVVLVVVLALLGWAIVVTVSGNRGAQGTPGSGTSSGAQKSSGPTVGTPLKIAKVVDFDPQGNGEENPDERDRAIDGNPSTAWSTMTYYNRADLGGLKDGVGLVLDLGSRQRVGTVSLELVGRGTDVQLRAADRMGKTADDFTTVASRSDAGTQVTLRPDQPVTARYLLVWLTKLPSVGGSDYKGGIAEVVVRR